MSRFLKLSTRVVTHPELVAANGVYFQLRSVTDFTNQATMRIIIHT